MLVLLRLILVLFLAMTPNVGQNSTESIAVSDSIIFTGKLAEVPDLSVKCGDTAIAVVFRFFVAEIVEGRYPHPEILVAIPCPDQNDEGIFVADNMYRVEATATYADADFYVLEDEYAASDLPRYWGLNVDPL
jgi:hypothetical protein